MKGRAEVIAMVPSCPVSFLEEGEREGGKRYVEREKGRGKNQGDSLNVSS